MVSLLLILIYTSFISLGLPDAVLGSAWPVISGEFNADISNMGIITFIIAAGTIISSLNSDKLIQKLGYHKITALSILTTAVSLFGFSISGDFISLCLWAIPYGLGAGSVDAALNNYAAINFESKHMNWLHCMWGVGASLGPYLMGTFLTNGFSFRDGYKTLYIIQFILSLVIFISAPVWKLNSVYLNEDVKIENKSLKLNQVFNIKGVKEIALAFFCYSAIEQTAGLWVSSYLVFVKEVDASFAASFAALFYLGITIGRGICGFISMKVNDKEMIRGGSIIVLCGILILFIPSVQILSFIGIGIIGIGLAPIFPAIIHSTPYNFGVENSQSITGVQMASAYTGTLLMPALFGLIGKNISFSLYPVFLLIALLVMVFMHELMLKKINAQK